MEILRGVFEGVRMRVDRSLSAPFFPVYEKINQKKKYVKFINKIYIYNK